VTAVVIIVASSAAPIASRRRQPLYIFAWRVRVAAAFFVVLFFYQEPPVAANTRPSRGDRLPNPDRHGAGAAQRRFTLFLVLMSGFFFVYNQVYNCCRCTPTGDRASPPWTSTRRPPVRDRVPAAGHHAYFGKMKAIRSIVVGTVIIGVSMLINVYPIYAAGGMRAIAANWLPLGSVFLILTVALIAFGELFTSARMYEYIGSLAPKAQEGLFLGYANLPLASARWRADRRRLIFKRHHGERRGHAARRCSSSCRRRPPRLGRADGHRLPVRPRDVAVQPWLERQPRPADAGASGRPRRRACHADLASSRDRGRWRRACRGGFRTGGEGGEARIARSAGEHRVPLLPGRPAPAVYEDVIGLTLAVDQGFSKIYQVSPTSFIGLVDESQGLHAPPKPRPSRCRL